MGVRVARAQGLHEEALGGGRTHACRAAKTKGAQWAPFGDGGVPPPEGRRPPHQNLKPRPRLAPVPVVPRERSVSTVASRKVPAFRS